MQRREYVYLTRDNAIDLVLMADGTVPSLASVNRMQLLVGAVTIDSQTAPGVFDWSRTLTADEAARVPGAQAGDSKLVLALGGQALAAGDHTARLAVYDDEHTAGIVWGDIPIRVE